MARTKEQRAVPLLIIIVAALLVGARVAAHFFVPEPKPDLVNWLPLEQVGSVARSTNRMILIDFTADWCAPCHLLDEQVFGDPAMAQEINARFVAVRLTDRKREEGRNSRGVEAMEQRYGVKAFPTVIIVDADGTERARMEGYAGPEEFLRVMESVR